MKTIKHIYPYVEKVKNINKTVSLDWYKQFIIDVIKHIYNAPNPDKAKEKFNHLFDAIRGRKEVTINLDGRKIGILFDYGQVLGLRQRIQRGMDSADTLRNNYLETRMLVEKYVFGCVDPEDSPTYGALNCDDIRGGVSHGIYGTHWIQLNDVRIRERVEFSVYDSWTFFGQNRDRISLTANSFELLGKLKMLFERYIFCYDYVEIPYIFHYLNRKTVNQYRGYTEARIYGGVQLDDIRKFYLDQNTLDQIPAHILKKIKTNFDYDIYDYRNWLPKYYWS
jgi:hypothetical protein